MASMNRAAAIRKVLDKLDEFDEALFDAEFSIGSVEDLREALDKRFRKHKVPPPEEVDAIDAIHDLLEDALNKELSKEERESEPVRNPRRRR